MASLFRRKKPYPVERRDAQKRYDDAAQGQNDHEKMLIAEKVREDESLRKTLAEAPHDKVFGKDFPLRIMDLVQRLLTTLLSHRSIQANA
jgi:hypothetical protein